MAVELKVPELGESITEVYVGDWLKSEGDPVEEDEAIVVIETDKANVELPAPASGTLTKVLKQSGEQAEVGEVIGYLDEAGAAEEREFRKEGGAEAEEAERRKELEAEEEAEREAEEEGAEAEEAEREAARKEAQEEPAPAATRIDVQPRVMPAARRALAEHGLRAEDVEGTGPGGRILKEDVLHHVEVRGREAEARRAPKRAGKEAPSGERGRPRRAERSGEREEELVPMSPMRLRIAERLVQAQQTAALLTTFNEIDMAAVIELRKRYREAFQERYGIKLGFMSFFVKAAIDALKQFPQLNATIREGKEIVYRNYYDIGVAVGGGRGLVVPVLRNAERMSFAEVEEAIADFAKRARENQLNLDELQGGTFTLSNGGVYGSLLSTPIVNPPQSGILGMHAIQERPVVRDGQVVVRPMMYVALTYDHRIVDGREAVTFLRRIVEAVEEPARLLLEV